MRTTAPFFYKLVNSDMLSAGLSGWEAVVSDVCSGCGERLVGSWLHCAELDMAVRRDRRETLLTALCASPSELQCKDTAFWAICNGFTENLPKNRVNGSCQL